jgi:phosphoribosylaminoimidazole carboxylase
MRILSSLLGASQDCRTAVTAVCHTRTAHPFQSEKFYLLQPSLSPPMFGTPSQARRMQPVGASTVASINAVSATAVAEGGLPRSVVLGILGGGQLGKMLAQEAAKMGIRVKVLDPTPGCPASCVAEQTVGSFRDAEAVKSFAAGLDVLTVEIEHIDADAMDDVAKASNVDIQPMPSTLRTIQDKYRQKQHFKKAGVPLGEFREIKCAKCASAAGNAWGYPYMLKSKTLAYDGRGNAVVESPEGIEAAVAALGGYEKGLYAEKWVPFVCELAVMVVRARDGSVSSFPVVQTIHKNNICHTTETPALVPVSVAEAARRAAEAAVECLEGAGVFGVELFLLPNRSIVLNEVAPRPHNSGHYTIEACGISQYEAHIRAILGWPLGDTSRKVGAAIMLNILGEEEGDAGERAAHEIMGRAYATPGAAVHWYGKEQVVAQRKLGHVTLVARDNEECRRKLRNVDPAAAHAVEAATARVHEALRARGTLSAASPSPFREGMPASSPRVGIIMGSDSDLPTMKAAAQILEEFGVECEVTVVSAHRTPERMVTYARNAHLRGVQVIIAGAGGAAHLPGMVAAMTPLPVIGVPVKPSGAHLDGIDALLSIVQMPRGVPVATVAIGNAMNAGLLALRILGAADIGVLEQMIRYQEGMTDAVIGKAARLEDKGWREY